MLDMTHKFELKMTFCRQNEHIGLYIHVQKCYEIGPHFSNSK